MKKPLTPTPQPIEADVQALTVQLRRMGGQLISRIDSAEDLNTLRAQQLDILNFRKGVWGKKDAILKPLLAATRATRALFAPVEERVEVMLGLLKTMELDYDKATRAALAKREETLAKKVARGDITEGQASARLARTKAEAGTTSTRIDRKVTITNRDRVPDKYWIIDEVALRADALAGLVIPGVEITEERIAVNPRAGKER